MNILEYIRLTKSLNIRSLIIFGWPNLWIFGHWSYSVDQIFEYSVTDHIRLTNIWSPNTESPNRSTESSNNRSPIIFGWPNLWIFGHRTPNYRIYSVDQIFQYSVDQIFQYSVTEYRITEYIRWTESSNNRSPIIFGWPNLWIFGHRIPNYRIYSVDQILQYSVTEYRITDYVRPNLWIFRYILNQPDCLMSMYSSTSWASLSMGMTIKWKLKAKL